MFVILLTSSTSFPTAPVFARRLCEAGRAAGRRVALLEAGEALPDVPPDLPGEDGEATLLLLPREGFAAAAETADLAVILVAPEREAVRNALRLAERSEVHRLPYFFLLANEGEETPAVAAAALALAQQGPVFSQRGQELPGDLWAELWRRAGQIPRLGPRIAPGMPLQRERRQHGRWLYRQTATLWQAGKPITCEVCEISPGGVAVEPSAAVRGAAELELNLPMLGSFEVEVAHDSGQRLGLRFPVRSAAQNQLVSELSRLLVASTPSHAPSAAATLSVVAPGTECAADSRLRLVRGLEALLLLAEQRSGLLERLAGIHTQARQRRSAA